MVNKKAKKQEGDFYKKEKKNEYCPKGLFKTRKKIQFSSNQYSM